MFFNALISKLECLSFQFLRKGFERFPEFEQNDKELAFVSWANSVHAWEWHYSRHFCRFSENFPLPFSRNSIAMCRSSDTFAATDDSLERIGTIPPESDKTFAPLFRHWKFAASSGLSSPLFFWTFPRTYSGKCLIADFPIRGNCRSRSAKTATWFSRVTPVNRAPSHGSLVLRFLSRHFY